MNDKWYKAIWEEPVTVKGKCLDFIVDVFLVFMGLGMAAFVVLLIAVAGYFGFALMKAIIFLLHTVGLT